MKKMMIIMVAVLLIVVIAVGIMMFYMFSPAKAGINGQELGKPGIMYHTGAVFLTNLKDAHRILKADVIIEVQDKETEEMLAKINYKVRDRIIDILGSIEEEDTTRQDFKDNLKIKIKKDLQDTLKVDRINGVYFNEFVIQ